MDHIQITVTHVSSLFNPQYRSRASLCATIICAGREREKPAEQWARDSRRPRELCVVLSSSPCVALSSVGTNETVNQRSTILRDPPATWRQLGYILKEECSLRNRSISPLLLSVKEIQQSSELGNTIQRCRLMTPVSTHRNLAWNNCEK